jgi:mono/diheme cytochrome c family protein
MREAEVVTRQLLVGLALATGLTVITGACGGGGNPTSEAKSSTSTTPASLQQGAEIFQAKCASCHDARLAAQVTRDFPNVADEIAVVANGRTTPLETMPPFGGVLTPTQIRDVVEYTRGQLGK